jgi:hypothetical protein
MLNGSLWASFDASYLFGLWSNATGGERRSLRLGRKTVWARRPEWVATAICIQQVGS